MTYTKAQLKQLLAMATALGFDDSHGDHLVLRLDKQNVPSHRIQVMR